MRVNKRKVKHINKYNIINWVNILAKTVNCWLVENNTQVYCYTKDSKSIYSTFTTFDKIKHTLDKLICIEFGNFSLYLSNKSLEKIEKSLF